MSLFFYIFHIRNLFPLSPLTFLTFYLTFSSSFLLYLLCPDPYFLEIADYFRHLFLKLDIYPKLHQIRIRCIANLLLNTNLRPNRTSDITSSLLNVWVWARYITAKQVARS